jgi:ketosteroid isomerase-like protein
MRLFALLTAAIFLSVSGPASARGQPQGAASDSVQVVEATEAFRAALKRGDSTAVAGMLLPEARVLESGGVETRREYLAHHFRADYAFLSALSRRVQSRDVRIDGDAAWVSTTSRMQGTYDGRAMDLSSAELLVLRRRAGEWGIAAVHWSSRSRE